MLIRLEIVKNKRHLNCSVTSRTESTFDMNNNRDAISLNRDANMQLMANEFGSSSDDALTTNASGSSHAPRDKESNIRDSAANRGLIIPSKCNNILDPYSS